MKYATRNLAAIILTLLCVSEAALAQRGGRGGGGRGGGGRGGGGGMSRGGGGGMSRGMGGMPSRGGARTSVSRPPGGFSGGGFNGGGAVNRPRGDVGFVDRGTINRGDVGNRQVNVGDIDVNGGYYDRAGCCSRAGYVAAGAVVGAAVTAAAIGSVAYTLPSSCSVVVVNDITYDQCGSTWYQPQFAGTTTTYVVVSPPQ
jgi:hypothetical protein